MAKVDAGYVKTVYSRLINAKQAVYDANQALHGTVEFQTARKAEHELELAQDCMEGLQALMKPTVI